MSQEPGGHLVDRDRRKYRLDVGLDEIVGPDPNRVEIAAVHQQQAIGRCRPCAVRPSFGEVRADPLVHVFPAFPDLSQGLVAALGLGVLSLVDQERAFVLRAQLQAYLGSPLLRHPYGHAGIGLLFRVGQGRRVLQAPQDGIDNDRIFIVETIEQAFLSAACHDFPDRVDQLAPAILFRQFEHVFKLWQQFRIL